MVQPDAIITLTMNPSLDVTTSIDRVVPGQKLRCRGMRSDPGGGGVNVSRMISILGGVSQCLVVCGGPIGASLIAMLRDRNVTPISIEIAGNTREDLAVNDVTAGQQYRFVLPGPTLLQKEWHQSLAVAQRLMRPGQILVASGSLPKGAPRDFYARIAKIARRKGARVLLDASGPALKAGLMAGVDFIKPNRHEFKELTGADRDDWTSIARASNQWVRKGLTSAVLVTRGADGALLTEKGGQWRIMAPSVDVKSPVGAGDSCMGAIALQMARGRSLVESCRMGVAAAAAAMLTPATQLARKSDVLRIDKLTRVWKMTAKERI